MPKYFAASGWEGDYEYWEPHWDEPDPIDIRVPDHEARDTGLVTSGGQRIMRAPRPVGFGRTDEW